MESEEAQKVGAVAVYYLLDATNFSSVTGKLRTTMPVHFAALHLCYNDITQYAVTCIGVYSLNHSTKVRFRPHFGTLFGVAEVFCCLFGGLLHILLRSILDRVAH